LLPGFEIVTKKGTGGGLKEIRGQARTHAQIIQHLGFEMRTWNTSLLLFRLLLITTFETWEL
jgi:hypothetical protein